MKKIVKILSILCLSFVLVSAASADTFWGCGSNGNFGSSPAVVFKLDTATGVVSTTYTFNSWSWAMGITCAPGNILYVVHNTTADNYNFKIAKIDASNGDVLSDTVVKDLTGTDIPILNSLQYYFGKIYAIENNSWGSAYSAGQKRGYVYEITLNGSGDPVSATLGAYVGGAPDGALAWRNGTWYASDWKTDTSSYIKTTTNIMTTNFSGTVGTSGQGLFAGWDFEADGDLLGVSWNSDFNVYQINLSDGSLTTLYNISSYMPTGITMLGGLSAQDVPTAITLASFDAKPGNNKVTLNWVTGDETDNLGFNIYRADAQDGEYVQINDSLLASKVGSGLGTSYEFTDSGVQNRTTYFYKLEDVDVNGAATQHGPIAATPRLIYGLFQ